ncbi:MAG: hypothetical protein AABY93_14610 [Bacteroidota bacterium]
MTVISIVFSAISLLITWRNEQKIQILENATLTRVEIAKTLNTVNQVIQIQLSFYELIEEDIVETSRIAIVDREPTKARDFIWEKFFKHRADILIIISQNNWEVAYTNLLTHGISADSVYIKSIRRLKKLQENQFNLLLSDFENEILEYKPNGNKQTAVLTDRLREIKNHYRDNHLAYTKIATDDLNSFCIKLIATTDRHLLFTADTLRSK